MTGRVALVTGAARGIGAATVRLLADQGYSVLALDWCAGDDSPQLRRGAVSARASTDHESHMRLRRGAVSTGASTVPYPLPTTADLEAVTTDAGDGVVPYVADVRDRAALEAAVADAVQRWGRLDAAVAGAAVMLGGRPLWETPPAEFETLWEIDVLGVWNTAAAAVPAMLANPDPHGCRFVAVASAAGSHGLFRLAGYNAAKHAVVGIVKGLAADLVGTGVTSAGVSPGSTRTDMLTHTASIYELEHPGEFGGYQLLRRLLEPEEIAAAIAFCCSREGAAVNGSVVEAQGGFPG